MTGISDQGGAQNIGLNASVDQILYGSFPKTPGDHSYAALHDCLEPVMLSTLFPHGDHYCLDQDGWSGTLFWAVRNRSLPQEIIGDESLFPMSAPDSAFARQNKILAKEIENGDVLRPTELHRVDDQVQCQVKKERREPNRLLTINHDVVGFLEQHLDIPCWYQYSCQVNDVVEDHFLVHLGRHRHVHAYVRMNSSR